MTNSAAWGSSNYLRIKGEHIKGNYKQYHGTDGLSAFKTAVDSALGGSCSDPRAYDGMGGYGMDYYYDGNSDYAPEAIYAYCGTGDSPTYSSVDDTADSLSTDIKVVPFIYRITQNPNSSLPQWGMSLYYYANSSTDEAYWSNDSGNVWNAFGAATWGEGHGSTQRVEMQSMYGGSMYSAWNSDTTVPRGYMYF